MESKKYGQPAECERVSALLYYILFSLHSFSFYPILLIFYSSCCSVSLDFISCSSDMYFIHLLIYLILSPCKFHFVPLYVLFPPSIFIFILDSLLYPWLYSYHLISISHSLLFILSQIDKIEDKDR